jgi:hypothetical protein
MSVPGKPLRLVETCGGCPEQYDLFAEDKQIGYLRLRHGMYTVSSPHSSGTEIHRAYPRGDGVFHEEEREKHLLIGILSCVVEAGLDYSAAEILEAVEARQRIPNDM